MSEYNPDRWEIIKLEDGDKIHYRVLGSWSGGYTTGNSWRLSSGLEEIKEDGDFYLMKNYSGSVYKCHKKMKGMNFPSAEVYADMQRQAKDLDMKISKINVKKFRSENER